jgi:hypothetical protein
MQITPARVASLLAAVAALLTALAPAIANLDVTSSAGCIAGAVSVVGILDRFLVGQRAHEARQATLDPAPLAASELPIARRHRRVTP